MGLMKQWMRKKSASLHNQDFGPENIITLNNELEHAIASGEMTRDQAMAAAGMTRVVNGKGWQHAGSVDDRMPAYKNGEQLKFATLS